VAKLWDKGYELNKEIEEFTVGNDFALDQRLVRADAIGSIAHAQMLAKIGLLSPGEFAPLKDALLEVIRLDEQGAFAIAVEDEDVHTRIENYLTEKLGDVGKKIHAGRSRNDQVLVDLRLYTKEKLLSIKADLLELCQTLVAFSEKHKTVPMPGRTHTQPAMPSTLGLWAGALLEALLDDLLVLNTAYEVNDQCPLGSAASYGVPIEIDRQLTADLLGFAKVQNNVLYANNSRGKFESIVLFALSQAMLDLSKLAQELILFSLREFGYFTLPDELCTGSSIMPQKKNPGGMELVRGKAGTLLGCLFQIMEIIKGLPSGYNRDFQETKEPYMRGLDVAHSSIRVCNLVMSKVSVNVERLQEACTTEIFATDRALELVRDGMPFRDAYREVALHLDDLEASDPTEAALRKRHMGAPGNLGLEVAKRRIADERERLEEERRAFASAIAELLKP